MYDLYHKLVQSWWQAVPLPPETQKAATTAVYLIVLVALAALAYALRPKPSNSFKLDNTLTTLTTRGSWLQLVIGRRRVAPVFAWAGDRVVEQEKAGGGKGGGGGSGAYVYFESGVHLICVGPATRLHGIYQNGVALWKGPIDRVNTPSGTQLETSEGSFVIWWGEESQPINTFLADPTRLGIASRWPYFCYIHWIKKKLGGAPRWSQIEYDIVAEDVGSDLQQTQPLLEPSTDHTQDRGVNYAHAIYQIATGTSPHGCGANPAAFDFGWLEKLGKLCRDEHTPVSIVVNDGRAAGDVIADLMQEHGFMMPQMGEVIGFLPLRPPTEAVPEFTRGSIAAPNAEQESVQIETEADLITYLYYDVTKNFKVVDLPVRDDGEARSTDRRKPQDVQLLTVIDRLTAQKCASRRQNETFNNPDITKFKVGYTARVLQPGMAFKIDGVEYRVNSRVIKTDEGQADLNVFLDTFSNTFSDWDPGDVTVDPPSQNPAPDLLINVLEIPYSIALETCEVSVLRIRGNTTVGPADVYVSRTFGISGPSFQRCGQQPLWARGGTLQAPLSRESMPILEGTGDSEGSDGPMITRYNDDILTAVDLSGDRQSHLSGVQLCIIGREICFLKKVTPQSGGDRLDGLIRARAGTKAFDHPAGTPVFIATRDSLRELVHPLIVPNTNLYFKTQPSGIELGTVPNTFKQMVGVALSPPPVANVDNLRGTYAVPEAIVTVNDADNWIEVAGIAMDKFHAGCRVFVADNPRSGLYHVYRSVQAGSNTRVYLIENIDSGFTVAGTVGPAAQSVGTYAADEDVWISFDYSVRDGAGATPSESEFGVPVPADTNGVSLKVPHEGRFSIKIIKPNGDVAHEETVDSDYPVYKVTAAMRNGWFGVNNPPTFTVSVTNKNGAMAAWTVDRKVRLIA